MPEGPRIPESQEDKDLIGYVDRLVTESDSVRKLFDGAWDKSLQRYLGDHWDRKAQSGLHQFVDNRTQNAIIATAAIQTEQRPRIHLNPVENDEEPLFFFTEAARAKLQSVQNIDLAGQVDPQILQGLEPVPPDVLSGLVGASVNTIDPITGEEVLAPILTEEDFDRVDDSTIAESEQKILDYFWRRSMADYIWVENIVNKGIIGHQCIFTQWNDEKNIPELINLHPLNVWIDPLAHGDVMDTTSYLIWDRKMSVDEARVEFPEHAATIHKHRSTSVRNDIDSASTAQKLGAPYNETNFGRDMVTIRTAWLKFQEWPKTIEEAVEDGDIIIEEIPESGEIILKDREGRAIKGDDPRWPFNYVTLQVQIIGNKIIEKMPMPFVDIPVGWNVNIPISFRPYGQGEPERLEDLQQAINRVISILHNYCKYYQSPQEYWPLSMMNEVKDGAKAHSHAGRRIGIADHLWERFVSGRKAGFAQDPPNMPSLFMEFLGFLTQEFDSMSGQTQVLQGRTDSSAESGRAIQSLQSAARGVIGFKSLYTELAIKHIISVWIGFIRDFLPESEWFKIVGGKPITVLRALRDRSKSSTYDVAVEVVSGKGTSRQIEEDRAVFNRQLGLLSLRTTMEKLNIPDVDREIKRIVEEQGVPVPQIETQTRRQSE